jgi:HSP20 family molecular chaperone IbpA
MAPKNHETMDLNSRVSEIFSAAKKGNLSKDTGRIYGFSASFDSSGKPVIEEFGNSPLNPSEGYMEPQTQVVEDGGEVTVYFTVPGARKKDVDLRVGADRVFLRIDSGLRRYLKEVKLSSKVDAKSTSAELVEHTLKVSLKRDDSSSPGERISIV